MYYFNQPLHPSNDSDNFILMLLERQQIAEPILGGVFMSGLLVWKKGLANFEHKYK